MIVNEGYLVLDSIPHVNLTGLFIADDNVYKIKNKRIIIVLARLCRENMSALHPLVVDWRTCKSWCRAQVKQCSFQGFMGGEHNDVIG